MSNSKSSNRSPSHPVRISFTGEAGAQALSQMNGNKGFISHHASIATSGMNGGAPFENPIQITSYGLQAETLLPKHVYSMNCKLIGTNDNTDDQLHFEKVNRINLGSIDKYGDFFVGELVDKISVTALGYVVARNLITDPAYKGKTTVVVTLKHTDYDPIAKAPVTWHTKHYIPPVRNMEKAQNLCQLGREVLLTGQIKDYDTTLFMWESKVLSISVCQGEITIAPTVPRATRGPTGGRIPLSLNRNNASTVASSSSVPIEPSSSPSATTKKTDPLFESLFGSHPEDASDDDVSDDNAPIASSDIRNGKRPCRR
ncbi:hypothetical protein DFH28DRAFT_1090363 [Melampsora americana]|nr:hypothetical protein DFH28DRAFT_1090363 [Melampsora americana]